MLEQSQVTSSDCDKETSSQDKTIDDLGQSVDHLNLFVSNGKIQWPFGHEYTPSMWQEQMRQNGFQGEHIALQLAAEVLFRRIVILPLIQDETTTTIEPLGVTDNLPPLYLLYFSETSFRSGHYQSIRPHNCSQIEPASEVEGSTSIAMDFGSSNHAINQSLLSLPECEEDISVPAMQSTTISNRTVASNKSNESRIRRTRDDSYMDQSNVIQEKRARIQNRRHH
jgi:hypothetical protein